MVKNEKELTAAVSKYLRKTKPLPEFLTRSHAVEYKFLKNKLFNFKSDLQIQQIPSLIQVMNEGLYYKISDQSQGMKPFDAFHVQGEAWLAIGWGKRLYYINPMIVQNAICGGKKSWTKDDIYNVSTYNIKYE